MQRASQLRVCFVLPGLHRVCRGAEIAFEAIAHELSTHNTMEVTLIGSGAPKPECNYKYKKAPSFKREIFERWPRIPPLRNEYRWEELSFVGTLWRSYQPSDFDINVTCSYPFTSWLLRAYRRHAKPRHVFVTQNGDWAPRCINAEYKFFSCDGLICTNPDFYQRHRNTWKSCLIPNGFDPLRFNPGPGERSRFGLPSKAKIVLVVSALTHAKHVLDAVRAVARVPGLFLLLVGDGPLRHDFERLAKQLLPGRHLRLVLPPAQMPAIYKCADTLLHLGRNEAFGNIYLEALGTGLPVVAHDNETTRWIFQSPHPPPEGQQKTTSYQCAPNVCLLDTANTEAVSEALIQSVRKPRNSAAQQHQHAAGRFSWQNVATQYADFLKQTANL